MGNGMSAEEERQKLCHQEYNIRVARPATVNTQGKGMSSGRPNRQPRNVAACSDRIDANIVLDYQARRGWIDRDAQDAFGTEKPLLQLSKKSGLMACGGNLDPQTARCVVNDLGVQCRYL